ncbi:MAG: hypothetical protein ACFFDB_18070 [Promethearchaeota archaeon]
MVQNDLSAKEEKLPRSGSALYSLNHSYDDLRKKSLRLETQNG